MLVKEAIELKKQLESNLASMLREYEVRTGLSINTIHLNSNYLIGDSKRHAFIVEVVVNV